MCRVFDRGVCDYSEKRRVFVCVSTEVYVKEKIREEGEERSRKYS